MFFDQFKTVCKGKGLSPCAVAFSAGMSKTNVTYWKRGQSPKLDTIVKLANQLGVPATDLIPTNRTQIRKEGK